MALKTSKSDLNGIKIANFFQKRRKKIAQRLGLRPVTSICNALELTSFLTNIFQFKHFWKQKNF